MREASGCMLAIVCRELIYLCKQCLLSLQNVILLRNGGLFHLRIHSAQNYAWLVVEATHTFVETDSGMLCNNSQSKLHYNSVLSLPRHIFLLKGTPTVDKA